MENKICDIHTHIVPEIDDGARNLEMSIEIMRTAYAQGTRNIVCSSHNWGNMEMYAEKLEELRRHAKEENIDIKFYPGCEIGCDYPLVEKIITDLDSGRIPTINRTSYTLVEFYPHAHADNILKCVKYIQAHGYKTIIAHMERYADLFAEAKWIPLLQEMGCLIQINAYSIQDTTDLQTKAFARQLLKEERVTFIGSDAHRTDHRPYMIENGIEYIYQHCDGKYAKDICYKNAERILKLSNPI